MDKRYTQRAEIIDEAKGYILNDRNKSYGEPDEDFQRIAAIASAMGFRVLKRVPRPDGDNSEFLPLVGSDVARFMIALKLSRLAWMPNHKDSWADTIGYAACGYETAMLEDARRDVEELVQHVEVSDLVHPGASIKMAGFQAINGDPGPLERMGLFLTEDIDSDCAAYCRQSHRFNGGCIYRIRKRRVDA